MKATISKDFTFEAAHCLPRVPAGHKCGRLHGHSYRVTVCVTGKIGDTTGWVMDFGDLSAAVRPIVDALDHRYLNDIPGLDNPTSEVLARWIHDRVGLTCQVVVRETCTSECRFPSE